MLGRCMQTGSTGHAVQSKAVNYKQSSHKQEIKVAKILIVSTTVSTNLFLLIYYELQHPRIKNTMAEVMKPHFLCLK